MEKEYIKIVNGKEFKIVYDKELLLSNIEDMRKKFNENEYLPIGTMPEEDVWIEEAEYNENIDIFAASLEKCTESINFDRYIDVFPKKKNGSFYKGRVHLISECNNSIYICEWHNTWIYYELRVSAISDYVAKIDLFKKVSTPA